MRTLTTAAFALALLCSLAIRPAAAADAEVRYVVTNNGDDVGGRGYIEYHPAGHHDGPAVSGANSGGTAKIPEGSYDVYVRFEDGAAKKEMWFDNQPIAGKVEKTVEVNVTMTEVSYVVTNGGDDVGGRGYIEYHRAGHHDGPAVAGVNSGGSVRMPAGNYDVYVRFEDGAARKEMWFDNQPFTGKVEKTVEENVAVTEVRYTITNGGDDVGGRGYIEYHRAGHHDGPAIAGVNSGGSARMPAGNYDVYVRFEDGTAKKEMWFDNQAFTGKVDKTVEVNVAMTEVRYTVTNNGEDVGGRGYIEFHQAGHHDGPAVAGVNSGGSVRMPVGNYDVYVRFEDGTAKKEMWFDNQAFTGKVEKTVEVSVAVTEVRYTITNNGEDVGGRGYTEYHRAGHHDGPAVAGANSGGSVRMPTGNYDVYVRFIDGTARKEMWFDNQEFTGKVEKTVEVSVAVTEVRYTITNNAEDVGGRGYTEYHQAGHHDGPAVAGANSGGSVRMPTGNYDVYVRFQDGAAKKEIWFDNQAFIGNVEKTVDMATLVAQVRYVITNDGEDVGSKATVTYFPPAKHDGPSVAETNSGDTARMPDGLYDVRVLFTDGLAHKEVWLNGQNFTDKVDKTIELGMTLAEPTVVVTKDGTDAGPQANVTYFPPGRQQQIGGAPNGQPVVIEAGTYDIRATLDTAEGWLRNTAISGKPQLAIDLHPQPAAPPPPATPTCALAAPGAAPEQVAADTGDFPYLTPLSGSISAGGKASTGPVYVQLPDARQPELVANASMIKWYRAPPGVSVVTLLACYHDGLLKGGWTIVNELHGANTNVTTHYGANSRNIWAFIHMDNNGYSITVADATVVLSTLTAALGANCHLALTGVLFDFNKSTLKPESDPILQQVSAMMTQDQTLKLEVQGHTDAIGSDAYNQPLSEARARSVVAWLSQHGVSASRLWARGYGKTRPVASNATDEGRAQNRRVEIANMACKSKG